MGPKFDKTNPPSHFCEACTQVVHVEHAECPRCGSEKPADGWTSIQEGFDAWLGRVLDGRYIITQVVGKGAMGTVYRASSTGIAREFAVKIINIEDGAAGLAPEQIRARLEREIVAIGRLRNPHVVPFYEVLELPGGFVGMVMDFVSGDTLEDVVHTEGALRPRRALSLLRQIANGVHEAHEIGMIHRDLKPENIMLEVMPSGDDFIHVLDFGIVRFDDGVSMTRGFLGTPLYASPEQATGGELDRRSDIYSLGAVLFFLLTSRPPFESENVYKILQAHASTAAPTLEEVAGHSFSNSVEDLVSTMLAKKPADRPATLTDVIRAIDRIITLGLYTDEIPDSIELVISGTTDLGLEDSSSVFESDERDRTGPKAAIFRKGSRSGVRAALAREREGDSGAFDDLYESTTGATTLGLPIEGRVEAGAAAPDGDLALRTSEGIVAYRAKETILLPAVPQARGVAISLNTVLVTTAAGEVMRMAPGSSDRLFQDVRRSPLNAVAADPNDQFWLAGSESGRLYRCRPKKDDHDWLRVADGPPVAAVAVDASAQFVAVARAHGEIECSTPGTIKTPHSRFSVRAGIRDLAVAEQGRVVAVLFDDSSVAVYLVDTRERIYKMREERHEIFAIAFVNHGLVGYFTTDGRLYSRQLDKVQAKTH